MHRSINDKCMCGLFFETGTTLVFKVRRPLDIPLKLNQAILGVYITDVSRSDSILVKKKIEFNRDTEEMGNGESSTVCGSVCQFRGIFLHITSIDQFNLYS